LISFEEEAMSNKVDLLESAVLALCRADRIRILESLLASLDDSVDESFSVETEWLAEAQRREAIGEAHMLAGESVLQELRARYA
jgi:hypothetical protein